MTPSARATGADPLDAGPESVDFAGVFEAYRRSLKPPEVEEPPDAFFNRPLGYLLARGFAHTPIRPNGVSFLSMCVGLTSAWFYLQLDYRSLVAASILLALYCVLDCTDGQLARMQGRSTRFGRVFDGLCDHVVGFATAFAGAWYASHHTGNYVYMWLGALALLSALVHNATFDYYKNTYIRLTRDDYREGDFVDEVVEHQRSMRGQKGTAPQRALLSSYRLYIGFQNFFVQLHNRGAARVSDELHYSPERAAIYREHNQGLMRVWSWFGVSTHVALMVVFGFFNRIEWYLLFRLVGMNVAYALVAISQRRATQVSLSGMADLPERA